jgi:hypothetical protein
MAQPFDFGLGSPFAKSKELRVASAKQRQILKENTKHPKIEVWGVMSCSQIEMYIHF